MIKSEPPEDYGGFQPSALGYSTRYMPCFIIEGAPQHLDAGYEDTSPLQLTIST